MPFYSSLLLSSWSDAFVPSGQTFAPPPVKIPPQVLASMKLVDGLYYAPLPKELKGKRYVAVPPKKTQARFRSGKMQRREVRGNPMMRGIV
jgi:hypothetical protein